MACTLVYVIFCCTFAEGTIMYVLMKLSKGKEGLRQITPTVWVLFAIFVIRYIQKSLA